MIVRSKPKVYGQLSEIHPCKLLFRLFLMSVLEYELSSREIKRKIDADIAYTLKK